MQRQRGGGADLGDQIGERRLRRDPLRREGAGVPSCCRRLHGEGVDAGVGRRLRLGGGGHRLHQEHAAGAQRREVSGGRDAEREADHRHRIVQQQRDLFGPVVVVLAWLGVREVEPVAIALHLDPLGVGAEGGGVDGDGIRGEKVDAEGNSR